MTTFQYQLLPNLTPEEYESLKSDIAARGVMVPVEYDEQGNVLDGHHRIRVCQELGLTDWPKVVRLGMSEDAKREHVLALNLDRRHLTREQRAELVASLRVAGWSTTRIADRLHVSDETVRRDLSGSTIVEPERVTGKDGKEYPAERQERAKPVTLFNPSSAEMNWLANMEQEKRDQVVDRMVTGEAKSLLHAKRLASRDEMQLSPPPEGKFRVIYADPPWEYGNSGVIGSDNYGHAERHYPTMTIEELCAYEVGERSVKEMADDNAVLFLWVTSPLLEECFPIIEAWGFDYKTSFVWDKVKHNFGHYNSVRHELLLVCTRGSCLPESSTLHDSVIELERSEVHSDKPAYFRELIESMYPSARKVELFARGEYAGWTCYGNQLATKF